MTSLRGKVALVTGGGTGIGRATAIAMAREGASIVVLGRREATGEETVGKIHELGGEAVFLRADVADAESVRASVNETLARFGRLDAAVNSAAVEGPVSSIVELPEGEWREVIDINLSGSFHGVKYAAAAMLSLGRGGAIVNVASIQSFLGCAGEVAYTTSKHAVLGLTRVASAELAPHGIRVNAVCPGVIETPMVDRFRASLGDEFYADFARSRTHVGRLGRPDEIASLICWLCSDQASYVTGASLIADGGTTAML